MSDPRDYKIELSSTPAGERSQQAGARPYLSVYFACCGVYLRIYRSADGKAYRGACPRCCRPVNFLVGSGGTESRFFVVK